MRIVNLGVSHRIAPAEVLEKLAVPSAQCGSVLARLCAVPSIAEAVVLSTCNRVEVYAAARGPAGPVARAVADVLAAHGRVEAGQVLRLARIRVGGAAAEHLFSVACGLDSMAVGEDQIVAQIKDAARAATAAGTAGPVITGLIDAALRASKRARTQTTISTEGISLARAGLDLAAAHLGGLAARHAVVVGTGSTGKLAARLLTEAGVGRLWVASRSQERSAEAAAAVHGRPLRTSDVPAALADAGLLVTATGAAAPVVLAEHVRAARAQAGGRPLVVLDLGMYRARSPGPRDRGRRGRGVHRPAGPSDRGARHRRDARADQAARGRRAGPAARPASGPQRLAAGRDGSHRAPHLAQDFAPADRAGQGVLGRPGRARLPRRAAPALRPAYRSGQDMSCPHHPPLRLGTRGSPLALAQASQIARQLREQCGRPAVLVTVATPGDSSTAPIERLGTTGVFTTTLREALLRGAVDLVVHSAKDLPTAPVPGLQIAAFPAREDPRDALVWPGGTHLDALPPGARIGTGSPRRAALLRAADRQLQIVPIRGNVDTRLRKLADGQVDALVLAMAGLSRLGLLDSPATPLDPSLLMPAPAQGVLAVECRTDDPITAARLSTLDHPPTRAAASAERGFLAALDAGCTAPVGALAAQTLLEHGGAALLHRSASAVLIATRNGGN